MPRSSLTPIEQYIEANEGRMHLPYKDTVGKLTIGVGFNLTDVGLYDEEIDFILRNRVERMKLVLPLKIATWEALSGDQRLALMDMYYNLGWPRLSKFKRMLKHIDDGKYDKAAEELLNSKYASQVGQRAKRNAELLRKAK
jgi:lysozyme